MILVLVITITILIMMLIIRIIMLLIMIMTTVIIIMMIAIVILTMNFFEIILGDSVLGIPSRKTFLQQKIAALLPQYYMNIVVSGKLGVRLFVLNSRVHKILAEEDADVVILYADSDLSNVNEDVMSIQQKLITREFYKSNFTQVVQAVLGTRAKLALSGERKKCCILLLLST